MAFNLKKKQSTNKKTTDKPKTKKKITRRHIVNSICIVFLSSVLVVSLVCFVLLQNILSNSGDVTGELTAQASTRIYDKDGELITTLAGNDGVRENKTYDQMPQVVIDAFLSIEDSRFFSHNGFDLPRFIKSGYENVLAGGFAQGGSTLTMQLVDVTMFQDFDGTTASTSDKLEQKVLEIFKSMEIEDEMSKEEIIENYLNQVNFGGAARGIQKGAEYYFGKDVEQLNLSEAAFLAGVVNAPGYYNPYLDVNTSEDGTVTVNHYDEAVERRDETLYLMKYHGYITQEEYDLAISTELAFTLSGETRFSVDEYSSFVQYVTREVLDKTGVDPYTTSMDIYTTMDRSAQDYADAICNETAEYTHKEGTFAISEQYNDRYQAAFAVINKDGGIVALGNGFGADEDEKKARSWNVDKEFGSTVKPLIDYAPAIEDLGWASSHVVPDEPIAYATSVMFNADRTFHGDMDLQKALNWSYNVPAYYTLSQVVNKIGNDGVKDYLTKLGFDEDVVNGYDESGLAYSIGGREFKGTPLELASAYQTLANSGEHTDVYSVSKVVFKDGSDEYVASQESQRVYSDGTSWITNHLLSGVVDSAITDVKSLSSANYQIYGKSGTTHYDEITADEYGAEYNGRAKDKWVVGYTDEYIVASWAGYDAASNAERNYLNEDEIMYWNLAGDITRTMLDVVTNYGETASKSEAPQSDEVTSITHVAGVFPYAAASGDVSSDLVVNGFILKKHATTLDTISPDPLEEPSSFTMSLTGNNLEFTLSEYPDKEKLKVAEKTKTVTVAGVSASVTKIFDKSFLYGAVTYQVDIELNGTKITTVSPENGKGTFSQWGKDLENGDKIKACGYYKYANTESEQTAKKCQELTVSGVEKTYTIDNSFSLLFDGNTTAAQTKTKIDSYMKSNYEDVKYEIIETSSVSTGSLDTDKSTLQAGTKVDTKTTYYIYIGK